MGEVIRFVVKFDERNPVDDKVLLVVGSVGGVRGDGLCETEQVLQYLTSS